MQSTLNDAETESVWRQLAPLLEDAMSRLSQKERTLVALQFFENKTGAETAALLGINEWAARKRIERAMDKLQKFFSNRGINSTTATIAGAISANSVQAAPIGLAKTATAVALAKGATASASTLTFIKGALKIMAWSKAKTAFIVSVGLLLGVGTATVLAPRVRQIYIERDPAWISVTNASGVAVSNVIFQGKHFSTGPVDLSSIGGAARLSLTAFGLSSDPMVWITFEADGKEFDSRGKQPLRQRARYYEVSSRHPLTLTIGADLLVTSSSGVNSH